MIILRRSGPHLPCPSRQKKGAQQAYPPPVICEIRSEDGTMARVPELIEFAKKHALKIVTIKDLIKYRMRTELFVKRLASVKMPTVYGGEFTAIAYANDIDNNVHLALVKGE